jgi:hypothetical protein
MHLSIFEQGQKTRETCHCLIVLYLYQAQVSCSHSDRSLRRRTVLMT